MTARMLTRNVMIDGHRTTIRLESAIWVALDEICVYEGLTRHEFCTLIDAEHRNINRAQAVRAVVANYLRLALKSGQRQGLVKAALDETDDLAV